MDSIEILHRLYMDCTGTLHGLYRDSTWTVQGLDRDSTWTSHRLYMDSTWTNHGLYDDSTRTILRLYKGYIHHTHSLFIQYIDWLSVIYMLTILGTCLFGAREVSVFKTKILIQREKTCTHLEFRDMILTISLH
jgi:hypothetical protein